MKTSRTKILLRISTVAIIPLLLSSMMMSMIALEWVVSGTGNLANRFLTGEFARTFSLILFGTGFISISIIFGTILILSKYTSKIDRLDDATIDLYQEQKRYRQATNKVLGNL